MLLFDNSEEKINLHLQDADISYYPSFLDQKQARLLFEKLEQQTKWQQDHIKIYGKTYPQPRLTKLFSSNQLPYSYSNITMYPEIFPRYLEEIKIQVEKLINYQFTTCLANLYRNGQDSNGWHADNEKELGLNPVIASLSLGQPRDFQLKHKNKKELKTKIKLAHGSLLVMQGVTQCNWLHQVPKTKKIIEPRINLTFRKIDTIH